MVGQRWLAVRDAWDVLRRARSPRELMRALVPAATLERRVLNLGSLEEGARSPAEIAERLRSLRHRLAGEALVAGQVNYRALAGSETFGELERTSRLLRRVRAEHLVDDAHRLAFFINLYNVLAIHGVVALGIGESAMEVPTFFSVVSYQVGDEVFSLDDLENGVLRRNAPHPVTGKRLWREGDARAAYCPTQVDPRVHAALVCCAKSCPPIAFYEADRIHDQLDLAARAYVGTQVRADERVQEIRLPITFRYYAQDWGGAGGTQAFLLRHAQGAQRLALERAFLERWPFAYDRYDWSLNRVL